MNVHKSHTQQQGTHTQHNLSPPGDRQTGSGRSRGRSIGGRRVGRGAGVRHAGAMNVVAAIHGGAEQRRVDVLQVTAVVHLLADVEECVGGRGPLERGWTAVLPPPRASVRTGMGGGDRGCSEQPAFPSPRNTAARQAGECETSGGAQLGAMAVRQRLAYQPSCN